MKAHLLLGLILLWSSCALAEFRSAKDMQKECSVALEMLQGRAEKNSTNVLYTGECIGFIQGVGDASQSFAENVKWYRVCMPDSVSTGDLIQRFVFWVDANPKYKLASTSLQMMFAAQYPCRK